MLCLGPLQQTIHHQDLLVINVNNGYNTEGAVKAPLNQSKDSLAFAPFPFRIARASKESHAWRCGGKAKGHEPVRVVGAIVPGCVGNSVLLAV